MKIDFFKDGEGAILMTAVGTTLYLDKISFHTALTCLLEVSV